MQYSKARELREERGRLVAQMQALPLDTVEQRAAVNVMINDIDVLKSKIDTLERVELFSTETRASGAPPNGGIDPNLTDEAREKLEQSRFHKAWVNSMRFGLQQRMTSQGKMILGIGPEDQAVLQRRMAAGIGVEERASINATLRQMGQPEMRDMGSAGQGAYPGATTGFFVPVGFTDRVEEAMKYYGPMLKGGMGMPEVFDTATGQVLPFPTDNDTTVFGELIGENQQVTQQDVVLGQILLGAYKYSSRMVKVSIELLQDSAFDFESYLIKKFAIRLGRILNNHFTVGTGGGLQPNGIVTASTLGVTAIGSSGNDGTNASTNTIGSDDLINLEHSVDPLYRPGAKYMMHDSTLRQIKTIKDKFGRPLWLPGLAVAAPDTINSYGYEVNNDMGTLQVTPTSPQVVVKSIVFGQLSKYLIRRVKEMSVLRLEERFADYGQIAFLAFARYDGQLLDAGTHPVKYLQNLY